MQVVAHRRTGGSIEHRVSRLAEDMTFNARCQDMAKSKSQWVNTLCIISLIRLASSPFK